MMPEVTYCGYVVGKDGVKPLPGNVESVEAAPSPTNVTERSFLGMVNYYNTYLKDLATVAEPLHVLLKKGTLWSWTPKCDKAFREVKNMLCTAALLMHFDPAQKIVVHCDASQYGVGVVLGHILDDGTEKPVSYASRTLTNAERTYATIEKEGLALVFAVKKFHQYLYGGPKFQMFTDHKPLLGLFAENSALPSRAG